MEKYQDPENANIDFVKHCESGEKLIKYCTDLHPDIIHGISDKYTKHLKLFEKNWHHICTEVFKCTPQKIIVVKFIPTDHKDPIYKILNSIYSKLSKMGYVVRTNKDLELCKKCNNAILSPESCEKLSVKYKDNCEFYLNSLSNQR